MTLQEMRDKRNTLISEARALSSRADKDTGKLAAADQEQYDKLFNAASDLKGTIEREEKLEAEERDLATSKGRQSHPTHPGGDRRTADDAPQEIEYRGRKLNVVKAVAHRTTRKYQEAFSRWLGAEQRTAASFANDIDADGGYLHAPLQFVAELIKGLDEAIFVRKYARVFPVTSSDSLGAPKMTTRPGDADWTSEVGNITPDAAAQLALRELTPAQLTKEVDISMKLLRTSTIPPEQIVTDELVSIFARTEEKAYLTGDGTTNGQPLGVFTADATGISTGRDVSTGNTATAITMAGLTQCKYKITAANRAEARWLFHRDGVKNISLITDSNGQYLWQPSKSQNEPDMLLGHAVDESEYAPSTFTAGLYVGILANWKNYWIADLMGLEIQRLSELLARSSKIGFIGRKFTDAMPVKEEGFARVKLAAS